MATILNIETSTSVCSCALTYEGQVVCQRENHQGHTHATLLSDFVKDCLDEASRREMKLDAVAVSIGPGSYTGLRIGLSEAKGLAYALSLPLIGVDTLKLLAVEAMFREDCDESTLFAPMIDARRMEVYTAVYDLALNPLLPPRPLILEPDSFAEFLASHQVIFCGDGSSKARDLITSPSARFVDGVVPLASGMTALSELAFRQSQFLDLAYSVPTYLKDFQATKPKRLF